MVERVNPYASVIRRAAEVEVAKRLAARGDMNHAFERSMLLQAQTGTMGWYPKLPAGRWVLQCGAWCGRG